MMSWIVEHRRFNRNRRSGGRRLGGSFGCLLVSSAAIYLMQANADHTPNPTTVVIAGSMQSELGCPGDWQPDCVATSLSYDAGDDVWQGTFTIPAGSWEYKGALNGSWDENYGQNATQNGANIPLVLSTSAAVKFYYDHKTHWVTDNSDSSIAVAAGSFQSELGCPGDWQPDCLRSWLQDPDGDGVGRFTALLPGGSYETKVAHNESWDENYGAGGVQNGPNIPFTVPGASTEMLFEYDFATHILSVGPVTPLPEITIDDVAMSEGDTGTTAFTFTVTRTDNLSDVSVDVATADDTASAGSDYTTVPATTLNFTAGGSLTQQVTVNVSGDTTVELNETFLINLSNPVDAVITDDQGVGTIQNDDSATLSINDVAMPEGAASTSTLFVFTVTLAGDVDTGLMLAFSTADDTATTADNDYTTAGGPLQFVGTSGEERVVGVSVNGDDVQEPNETFLVNLGNLVAFGRNVTFADGQGQGTITNDDSPPVVTQHPQDRDLCVGEDVTFTAAASGAPAPTVQWQVDDGSGFADIAGATSPTLTIPAVTADLDGNRYQAVFMNASGSDTSSAALLSLTEAPVIATKASVLFGPELTSEFVSATDGMFQGRVHVTWSAVDKATEYQVWRAEYPDLSDAAPVTEWSPLLYFNDYDVSTMEVGGIRCARLVLPVMYYYYVVSRNDCFESEPSTADSGYAKAGLNTVKAGALPASQDAQGLQVANPDSVLAVRLVGEEAIDPESVSGIIYADSPLDLAGVAYGPVSGDDWREIWVTYTPVSAWKPGEEIWFTTAARTVSGVPVGPVTYAFSVEKTLHERAGVYQPVYTDFDASRLDLTKESVNEAVLVDLAEDDLPVLEGGVGAAYALKPAGPYLIPHRIWLPVPAGVDADSLSIHFYLYDGPRSRWLDGATVSGWFVPDSERILELNGVTYYGVLVTHGGMFHLGPRGMSESVIVPAALMEAGNGAAWEFLLILAVCLFMHLMTKRRTISRSTF